MSQRQEIGNALLANEILDYKRKRDSKEEVRGFETVVHKIETKRCQSYRTTVVP